MTLLIASTRVQADSILDAANCVLENNLSIKNAELSVRSTEYDSASTRGGLLPSLSLSANTTYNRSVTEQNPDDDVKNGYNSYGYSLSLSQALFDPQTYFKYRNSRKNVDIEELKLLQRTQSVLSELAIAYLQYLKFSSQRSSTIIEQESATQRLKQVSRNIELGNTPANEIYEVRSQALKIEQSLLGINDSIEASVIDIHKLTYQRVIPTYDVPTEFHPSHIEEPIRAELNNALTLQNFDILIAELQFEKSRLDIRESQSAFAPTISASASYSHNDSNNATDVAPPKTGRSETMNYSLNLSLPLIQGGVNYAGYQKSAVDYDIAKQSLQETVFTNSNDLATSINSINQLADSSPLLRDIVRANYSSFQGISRAYSLGTRTLTDVLAAETKLFGSVRDYNDNIYDYQIAQIRLATLLGEFDLDQLIALHQQMQPITEKRSIVDAFAEE